MVDGLSESRNWMKAPLQSRLTGFGHVLIVNGPGQPLAQAKVDRVLTYRPTSLCIF